MQLRCSTKVIVAQSYPTLMQNPWTVARQSLLSIEFSRQAYWSGLPFPTAENLPDPGIEPTSLASPALAGEIFTTAPPEKPKTFYKEIQIHNFKKHCK